MKMRAYLLRRILQRSVARRVKHTRPYSDRESPEQLDEEPDQGNLALHQRQTSGDWTHALRLSAVPHMIAGVAESLPRPSRPHRLRILRRIEE